MKVLLDNGLPRSAVMALAGHAVDAVHVGDIGMADAPDAKILERAANERRIAVTLDADFHTWLALTGATSPSVIRIRVEGLKGVVAAALIAQVIRRFATELNAGAAISIGPRTARCHLLLLK